MQPTSAAFLSFLSRANGSGAPDGPAALGSVLAAFFLGVLLARRDFRDLVIVVVDT